MAVFDLNPLKELLLDEGATLMPYGVEPTEPGTVQRASPAGSSGFTGEAGSAKSASADVPLLAVAFGPIELEYASLRKDCVIIDRPDRAVIEVSGADARDFLGRMLTNDVAALEPGRSCNAFWLNRKGRIDADLRVLCLAECDAKAARFLLDVERGSLDLTLKTLGSYVITEDVTLKPRHDLHRLSLHGPRVPDLLLAASAAAEAVKRLAPNANAAANLGGGTGCWVDRHDTCGVPGIEVYAPRTGALELYQSILRAGRPDLMRRSGDTTDQGARGEALAASKHAGASGPASQGEPPRPESIRLRPCGWFAYNIARIEAGTPLFKIDFGPENLPAETGVIDDRVNFKKGCYLGQEVVARMHARGHPKQRLVALRFDDDLPMGPDGLPPLPVQGDRVMATPAGVDIPPIAPTSGTEPEAGARAASILPTPSVLPAASVVPAPSPKPAGSITSSTFSPMLGRVPVAFAMVAWSHVSPGTRLMVETDTGQVGATVQDGLRLVP